MVALRLHALPKLVQRFFLDLPDTFSRETEMFTDFAVRRLVDSNAVRMIAPSEGVHLVFERSFLPSTKPIMVPHTRDGRVIFALRNILNDRGL